MAQIEHCVGQFRITVGVTDLPVYCGAILLLKVKGTGNENVKTVLVQKCINLD